MFCHNCLKPCDTTIAEIGIEDHYDPLHEMHSATSIMGEVSDCCEAELSKDYPGVLCVACDNPGTIRCTECGEFYCEVCRAADQEVHDRRELLASFTHDQLLEAALELLRDATRCRRQLDDLQGIIR